MFSKALFKQSWKANRLMWSIITLAVCFMLVCVMIISGGGDIYVMKNALQDAVITGEIDSQLENRAISYYSLQVDGLREFDKQYVYNFNDTVAFGTTFDIWTNKRPNIDECSSKQDAIDKIELWKTEKPSVSILNPAGGIFLKAYNSWLGSIPDINKFSGKEEYKTAYNIWAKACPKSIDIAPSANYATAIIKLQKYIQDKAIKIDPSYTLDSTEGKEMLGTVMVVLNPSNQFDSFYTNYNEDVPSDYDIKTLVENIMQGQDKINNYLATERQEYIDLRAKYSSSIFLAGNMTSEETVNVLLERLSKFGVTKEKYDSYNYNYQTIKTSADRTVVSYKARFDYELDIINDKKANGEYATIDDYYKAIDDMNKFLVGDLTNSMFSSMPEKVASGLEEIGQMDLFSLIVGSIFFKMAGLLLPIIYMIMVSNNLIAGQVDSGSMAYILSTSTKRKQVTFTQAVFLVGSLFAMFMCTTITSVICLAILGAETVTMTYLDLILLNLGAFISLFAMSGICFLTSCWFDRSKKSMALGGGLSMFFLVATMLGLFGSKVIPSVVRLDALNYFNYVSIISLFDVISILDGTIGFVWKFFVLLGIGLLGYIIGSIKFKKKDLPL